MHLLVGQHEAYFKNNFVKYIYYLQDVSNQLLTVEELSESHKARKLKLGEVTEVQVQVSKHALKSISAPYFMILTL